ncbi:M81 family metallopeptidase [Maritimibacter fusiformis]|uniref:M81 family metallopeptidase n=1 Tax=Maritimibacter fusiformis TaxID=2603819 RepID=A0A5D0RLQ4_9RHOB|nr:M81 family metallopeptidase [Maritimibacter fusiformis]TYB82383.1 M81 family metallopeptidase [Maritimibacter fusiformis]
MKRVAICGLHTECSSYSPLLQQAGDFTRSEGQALLDRIPVDFAALGIEALPLFQDRSVPGGPVAPELFAAQTGELLDRLAKLGPLDGVLLVMHGAMFVPGIDDPEGEFIAAVRALAGPDAIIAGSFDLHGQVTQQIVDNLDIFAGYRTAPHVDVPETHARAARMLARALAGGPRPVIRRAPVPLLVSGEMSSTFVEPCRNLYAALPGHDEKPGVWDANLMIGYVWADSPRATAAAVVTGTDLEAAQAVADEIGAAYWAARGDLLFDMETMLLGPALDALAGEAAAILADSGDNPTAGGVGDRADVLEALIARGTTGAVVAGIADPEAHAALANGAAEVTLGGSLGGGGPRLTLSAEAVDMRGECAVITSHGLRVVVTARRRPFHDLADFERLGIDLGDVPLLVVKSGYLSTDLRALPRRQVMALTDGAVSQDTTRLENRHRPAGTVLGTGRRG